MNPGQGRGFGLRAGGLGGRGGMMVGETGLNMQGVASVTCYKQVVTL